MGEAQHWDAGDLSARPSGGIQWFLEGLPLFPSTLLPPRERWPLGAGTTSHEPLQEMMPLQGFDLVRHF